MLRAEGRERGISSRKSAMPQRTGNVLFGTWSIARARMTVMTKIMTPPARLICSKLISRPSFQLSDDLLEPFYLFGRELFSAEKRRKQLVGRAIIDLVEQFICFRLLNRRLGN